MSVYKLEQQGGIHAWENCPCHDRVHVLRRENVESATLCDGAGSLSGAQEAARAFSEGMNTWLADHFHTSLRGKSCATVRQLAVREIGRILNELTRGVESARDIYGCTLLSVCRDPRTNEALVLHLGDGVILGWHARKGLTPLTLPEHGEVHRSTWLVNNSAEAVAAHLRVLRIRPKQHIGAYCLMSDGSEGALYLPTENGLQLHPVTEQVVREYLLRPATFRKVMPAFVEKRICPADDFSIALLGDLPAESLPRSIPQRIRRQFAAYLSARRRGLSSDRAAREAGWHRRDIGGKRHRLLLFSIEEA